MFFLLLFQKYQILFDLKKHLFCIASLLSLRHSFLLFSKFYRITCWEILFLIKSREEVRAWKVRCKWILVVLKRNWGNAMRNVLHWACRSACQECWNACQISGKL